MNAVTTLPAAPATAEETSFRLAQRRAMALSQSTLVPEAYRGEKNMPNVLIALEVAQRIGASPLQVMQSLHIIQGRPSWSSSFLIATVNACGRFTPMRFEVAGNDPTADSYRVRAYADDKASGERCTGPWITWAMVKAEGWLSKGGSKWKTMPELMFMYRAAGFWTRVYAPELSMGLQTQEESEDIAGAPLQTVTVAARDPEALAALQAEITAENVAALATGDAAESLTTQEVHDALATATTRDALDEAASCIDLTPEAGRGALHALYGAREKELLQ